MVIAIPLPFLDYHPLVQPVRKSTIRPFRWHLCVFWCLVILQFFSSIVYLVCDPELSIETMFVLVPSLLGFYVAWSLVPMRFFVLFFLAMPLDICIGVHFISRLQKPSFGFRPLKVEAIAKNSSSQSLNIAAATIPLNNVNLLKDGTFQVLMGPEKLDALRSDAGSGGKDIRESIANAFAEHHKAMNSRAPSDDLYQWEEEGLSEHKKPPHKGSKWVSSKQARGVLESDEQLQKQNLQNSEKKELPDQILVLVHRKFSQLKPMEKLQLLNLLVYSSIGISYCMLSWYFYRKLGDAAAEELQNPIQTGSSPFQSNDDIPAVHTGKYFDNPLFATPRSAMQEPPPLYPFTGKGSRLGSDVDIP